MSEPKTWRTYTLGELCSLRGGAAFKPALQGRALGDIPFIKVSDFNTSGNEISIRNANHWVDEGDRASIQGAPFLPGTTVFAKIGEALKHNRKRILTRPTFIDNNLMGAVANTAVVDPTFLFHLLRTVDIGSCDVGTSVPYVKAGTLAKLAFDIPPLETQRRIASILSAYDDLIEVNRRRVAILEEMARGLFEEWFVRFRFPGHESVPMVETPEGILPREWQFRRLGELGDVITGKTPSKAVPEYFGYEVPFLKIPDMHGSMFVHQTGERLSPKGASSQAKKTIPAGSICVSCIGTIGLVAITTRECQTNQQINTIVPAGAEWREFLYFWLSRSKTTLVNLGSNGATMGNVNKQKFSGISLACPPAALLKKFNDMTKNMLSLIEKIEATTLRLAASRDLLLPRLISGQLSVEAAERELEAA